MGWEGLISPRGFWRQPPSADAPRGPTPLIFEGLQVAWSWKDTILRIALQIQVVRSLFRRKPAIRGLRGASTRGMNSIRDGTASSPVGSGPARSKERCWDRSVVSGSACHAMGFRADWLSPSSEGAPRGRGRFQLLRCNACNRLCLARFTTRYWNRKPMGSGSNIGMPKTSVGSA